jgi:hypothetical protein
MKKLHKRILVLAFLLSLSLPLSLDILADPGAPGSDPTIAATGGQFVSGEASGVPLDGGVIELLIAGAAFLGYKKAKGLIAAKGK